MVSLFASVYTIDTLEARRGDQVGCSKDQIGQLVVISDTSGERLSR